MRAGAQIVKLEEARIAKHDKALAERGIPVCAHMGLTPSLSGSAVFMFRAERGTGPSHPRKALITWIQVPIFYYWSVSPNLAKTITDSLEIPVIGIGAGPDTTAQIMVLHDLLGVSPITPKFVKNFLVENNNGIPAIETYVSAVKGTPFRPKHCFD